MRLEHYIMSMNSKLIKLSRIWIKCEFAIDGINDENNLKAAIDELLNIVNSMV